MLINELLDQGANPLLKVEGNLLNQFSVKDKEEIKADPILKKAVLELNAKIQKFSYEQRIHGASPAEKYKKYKAFLTSSTQHRQLETERKCLRCILLLELNSLRYKGLGRKKR